jgi:hypothetical protein
MSPVNVAIAISALSLVVSFTSLGWNVYKEFCLKARLKVTVGVAGIMGEAVPEGKQTKILFKAVNHGPGEITVTGLTLDPSRKQKRDKDVSSYFLAPETSVFATPLPVTLKVGEEARILVPYDEKSFLGKDFKRAGVLDSFQRSHWASDKSLQRAKEQYNKEFCGKG